VVAAADQAGLDGVILGLADQPLITAAVYNRLVQTHRQTGRPIVTSEYAGTVGVPVFFARAYFPNLLALGPDQGCKGLILKNLDDALKLPCPEAETDIDTPGDALVTGNVVCGNEFVHGELVKILRK